MPNLRVRVNNSFFLDLAAYSAPAVPSGFGIGGNVELGFPGILNLALTVSLALVGIAILTQVNRNSDT